MACPCSGFRIRNGSLVGQASSLLGLRLRSRDATTSAMSSTGTSRPFAFTPSVIIVMQNGHATAIVSAPVASSSSVRSTLMRLPVRLLHEHAPAAGAAAQAAIARALRLDECRSPAARACSVSRGAS